jgi:hypothetical protein
MAEVGLLPAPPSTPSTSTPPSTPPASQEDP